jgi:hypothetical protein
MWSWDLIGALVMKRFPVFFAEGAFSFLNTASMNVG